jgi:hypothetical protein
MKLTSGTLLNTFDLATLNSYVTPKMDDVMRGTRPMPVTLYDVRAFLGMFEKVGAAHCLADGSTLWVYVEWCNLKRIPYTLELHHTGMIPSAWIIRKIQL